MRASYYTPLIMWCPSVSLTLWANAWLAGRAAPDDVLDALSLWAPENYVTAYDSTAAQRSGLPWPDVDDAGVMGLLQTIRRAARTGGPSLNLVLPVPGDVRGLPAGSAFAQDALGAGEAVVLTSERDTPIGLVPEFVTEADEAECDDSEPFISALCWSVYSLPSVPAGEHRDLGEAEYELRSAVRAAANALTALQVGGSGMDTHDPRGMVEDLLESHRLHPAPDHTPCRALRVLENAAHVDAIITVTAGLAPIAPQSSSQVQLTDDALRPLATVVRTARLAAVAAIVQSAWS